MSTKLLSSVKGLRVLIAGGGSGLGSATARHLLDRGARVLILDRVDQASLKQPPPRGAIFCQGDVTEEAQVASAIATAERELGGLDAALNCAAIAFAARIYNWNTDIPFGIDDYRRILATNAIGSFNVCRLAAQLMAKNGGSGATVKSGKAISEESVARGVLINTGSLSATDGQNTQVMYAASKAAVTAMTLPLARDLAPLGIRVCCISPGYFDSPMCRREGFPARVVKYLGDHNRAIYRLGRPDEFASAVHAVIVNPMLNGVNIRLDAANRGFFFNRLKRAVPAPAASLDTVAKATA